MSNLTGRVGNNNQHLPSVSAPHTTSYSQSYPHPPPFQPQLQQPQQSGYPSHSAYPQQPPPAQNQQPNMVSLPPPPHVQQNVMYRQDQYDPYAQGQQPPPLGYPPQQPPPPQQQQQAQQQQPVTFNQPAPRQRTAIACRYCRRRKIRCYGFDTNPDGRCQNCSRFNQECVFTPVSSQTHAFVPAHTAYPQLRNQGRFPPDGRPIYPPAGGGPPLYGPHGQPLVGAVAPQQHPADHPHYPPPPNGPHQPYAQPNPYPSIPQQQPAYDARAPLPHQQQPAPHEDQRRSSTGASYHHPPPSNAAHIPPISPSSQPGYQDHTYQNSYYPSQQQDQNASTQRRTSPPSNYNYDAATRTSASPHASVSVAAPPPGPMAHYSSYPGGLHPPQVLPPANADRNTSPGSQTRDGTLPGKMSVAGMLDGGQSQTGRSTTDSSMLSRLNQRAP